MTDTFPIWQEAVHSHPKGLAIVDPEGTILFVNQIWAGLPTLYGLSPELSRPGMNLKQHIEDCAYDMNSFLYKLLTQLMDILNGSAPYYAAEFYTHAHEKKHCYLIEVSPLLSQENSSIKGVLLSYSDITVYKHTESQLEEALSHNRALHDLLPICAVCKKIKDEEEQWDSIENYLKNLIQAEFTHDICPDCIRLLYPQYSSILDPLDKP